MSASLTEKLIYCSTHALAALSFAIAIMVASISDHMIVCSLSVIIPLSAFSFSCASRSFENRSNSSNAKFLWSHGAIFFAIIAASIGSVHDQHITSANVSRNVRHAVRISAAARFSFNGASPKCLRYQRLLRDSPLVSRSI